jgi:hypothetical protein
MLPTLLSLPVALAAAASGPSPTWSGWGGNSFNNRWANTYDITTANIATLARRCYLTYEFGVSATPVIAGSTVYYPTWNGSFVALDYTTCTVQWTLNVTRLIHAYGPLTPQQVRAVYQVSRTSPQIDGDVLFFGTQAHALVVAVDRHTGAVLDTLQINAHPLAVITMSPTLYQGTLFVGTSSYEEPAPLFFPDYQCCTFIGNAAAVSFSRGKLVLRWSVATLPPPPPPPRNTSEFIPWWSGAGIWGSQPSISPALGIVFFGTGNVYSFPPDYAHCSAENTTSDACLPRGVNQESILALDIATGKARWVRRLNRMDAWNGACTTTPIDGENCPAIPPGTDSDFGMAPSFVPTRVSGLEEDVVVVGQKNGVIYMFRAADGGIVYARNVVTSGEGGGVGPGGGISWGVAVDDERVYFTLPYSSFAGGFNVSSSVYGALALRSGAEEWRTLANLRSNSIALTAPTVAGDLVLYPRTGVMTGDGTNSDWDNSIGGLVAIEKSTGKIVYEMDVDTNFQGGIAVQGRYVLFGTGYRNGQAYLGNGSLWVLEAGRLQHHGG